MDDESLQLLRELAARENGLPSRLARRLAGDSIGILRSDAKRFADELGVGQPRDGRGKFTTSRSFSDEIRSAAGRMPAEPRPEPIGDLGIGRGASAVPRTPEPPSMNALIRAAAGIRGTAINELAAMMGEDLGEVA